MERSIFRQPRMAHFQRRWSGVNGAQVETLKMGWCHLGPDDGAKAVADLLMFNSTLVVLDLRGNGLGNAGAAVQLLPRMRRMTLLPCTLGAQAAERWGPLTAIGPVQHCWPCTSCTRNADCAAGVLSWPDLLQAACESSWKASARNIGERSCEHMDVASVQVCRVPEWHCMRRCLAAGAGSEGAHKRQADGARPGLQRDQGRGRLHARPGVCLFSGVK